MTEALLIRLRPSGPWRFGRGGAREQTSTIGHSDTLFGAVTSAMANLGLRDAWLDATVAATDPAVRLTSLFPYAGKSLFVVPPLTIWPPAASSRLRWKSAQFIPSTLAQDLLLGRPLREERWDLDIASRCLIAAGSTAPFKIAMRSAAAVDSEHAGNVHAHRTACLEFSSNAGLWCAALFSSDLTAEEWMPKLKAAFRFLGDSGIGGERSLGWGCAEGVDFQEGKWPALLVPELTSVSTVSGYWMLSMFHPGDEDVLDFSRGFYASSDRGGVAQGVVPMVTEGSVIAAAGPPIGAARNVAGPTSSHPVWRAGFAASIAIPAPGVAAAEEQGIA